MREPTSTAPVPGSIGPAVVRREDPDLLRGAGRFVANLAGPEAAHVAYVTSPHAHAEIRSIDRSDAHLDGVLGIYTVDDLGITEYPQQFGGMNTEMVRPILARDRVRFVGEPIVAVVAETRAIAVDAAERVIIDYAPLTPVVDVEHAHDAGTHLFPGISDPVVFRTSIGTEPDFSTCEVVVTQKMVNQRVAAAPMEPRSGLACWDGDRLIHHSACQSIHESKTMLAGLYGLDPSDVRVVSLDVGGSFGAKFRAYPEEALLGWFARDVGRPVTWTETRSESMTGLGHGRGQVQVATMGGRRDGTIEKYSLHVIQDTGAYPLIGAALPRLTQTMLTGVYAISEAYCTAESYVTNTTPVGAFRGAGRPEATTAIERTVDRFAAACSLDPVEVRRRNLIPPDAFPYTTPSGAVYDSGDYAGALDLALGALDHDRLRSVQRERRDTGDRHQMGIGISTYVEVTASTPAGDLGMVELCADGSISARTSSTPHGQGHTTVFSSLIGATLGVAPERVEVVPADTDLVRRGTVTGGSRTGQIVGSLVQMAADRMVEAARRVAARLLETAEDDIVFDAAHGHFHVVGAPARAIGWDDLAATGEPISGEATDHIDGSTFPFGVHAAVVDVDVETGRVTLERIVAVDDAGTILNPTIFDGQIHGGLAGGIAQALMEEVAYDSDGNPLTTTFADYAAISAAELPSFELVRSVTPTDKNPLGVKGIGESGTVGSTAAVQNAVVDAVAHLGVGHIDLPLTAERVWRAIDAVSREG